MNAVEVAGLLKPFRAKLDAIGVERLLLVGSSNTGKAHANSDVDFVVEFAGKPTFLAFMELQELLEETFKRPVDLTTKQALRPEIAADVLAGARQVA